MAQDDFPVPPGYVISRKGGRPPKLARDVAIYLAKYWREKHLKQKVKDTDNWIMDRWGKDEGMNDPAHVRRSIGNAKRRCTWLNRAEIKVFDNGAVVAANIADTDGSTIELWRWAWEDAEGRMFQAQFAIARRVG